MFDRLKTLFGAPEAKASRTAKVLAFESGGRARWTPRDYAALAREGYLTNAIVHRAVRLIAENAASCYFLLYEGAAERDQHPLLQLLARPNPRQDGASFFEALYAHMLLSGNAYIEGVALDGAVRELYTLRPDRMKVVPGPDGWPEAYEYAVSGRSVRFDQLASDVPPILHLTFFHPLDDHYGLAPIEAGAVAVDVFSNVSIPKYLRSAAGALPHFDELAPDCKGALLALVYNRGASFDAAGARYTEMRRIKALMSAKRFSGIPAQLRSMKRLWTTPSVRGVALRREREARLFEQGLVSAQALAA